MSPEQGPGEPPSAGVQVAVWRVDLQDTAYVDRARALLSPEEIGLLDRVVEPHRTRKVLARAALRVVVSRRLDVSPTDVTFAYGTRGKPGLPGLRDREQVPVEFNLSSSGDVCLIAVTDSVPVGIDVEEVTALPDAGRLARRFFSAAEAAALGPGDSVDARRFLRYWTAKEAYAKGVGAGLSLPLAEIEVPAELEEAERATLAGPGGERWALVRVDPGPDTVATLAVKAPAEDLTVVAARLDLGAALRSP